MYSGCVHCSCHLSLSRQAYRALLPPPKQVAVFRSVCLSLFCLLDHSKSYERILMKFWGGVGWGVAQDPGFGGDPRHDPDPGIFKRYTAYKVVLFARWQY